jgi:hypothetical protein
MKPREPREVGGTSVIDDAASRRGEEEEGQLAWELDQGSEANGSCPHNRGRKHVPPP